MKNVVRFFALILSQYGYSAHYACSISRADFADDLAPESRAMFTSAFVGKSFTVDTRTGVMRGILENDRFKPPVVFSHGDHENSFVAATIVSPLTDSGVVGVDARMLRVKTWNESSNKPFTLLWDDIVFRGECFEQ